MSYFTKPYFTLIQPTSLPSKVELPDKIAQNLPKHFKSFLLLPVPVVLTCFKSRNLLKFSEHLVERNVQIVFMTFLGIYWRIGGTSMLKNTGLYSENSLLRFRLLCIIICILLHHHSVQHLRWKTSHGSNEFDSPQCIIQCPPLNWITDNRISRLL